jgi:hypothetical protein
MVTSHPNPPSYASQSDFDSSVASSNSSENDSDKDESDNDEGWINNSQQKSPTNKLFEMVKIQMEQADFHEGCGPVGYDSRFVDGPLPLMDVPTSPMNRATERPKTGMGYQLPKVEHKHGGADEGLLEVSEENEWGSMPTSGIGPEPLHDKKFSGFVSSMLSQRTKSENTINLSDACFLGTAGEAQRSMKSEPTTSLLN